MEVDKNYVRLIAPELNENDDRLDLFLDLAIDSIDETVWGSKADMGAALLCCHMVTMANRAGVGGTISSQSAGSVSVSYTNSQNENELMATAYGQLYLKLRRTLVITPFIV